MRCPCPLPLTFGSLRKKYVYPLEYGWNSLYVSIRPPHCNSILKSLRSQSWKLAWLRSNFPSQQSWAVWTMFMSPHITILSVCKLTDLMMNESKRRRCSTAPGTCGLEYGTYILKRLNRGYRNCVLRICPFKPWSSNSGSVSPPRYRFMYVATPAYGAEDWKRL